MKNLIYKEIGGMRKGLNESLCVNMTWPLAKIEIYPKKIILTYLFFKKIKLTKSEVDYCTIYKGFFGSGIRIYHHNLDYDQFIVFWSFSLDKLSKKLKSAGFNLK